VKHAPAAPGARSLRAWPAGLLLLAALLALMLASPRARAHASLVQSEPANASALAQAPGALTLRFNEDVTPTRIELVEADGSKVAPRAVHAGGATLTVQLPPLGEGVHALSWHVVSADGHPVAGVVTFSVGAAAARPTSASVRMPGSLAAAIWLARIALYIGLFVGVGGAFFAASVIAGGARRGVDPDRMAGARIIDAALLLGLLSAAASPGLQGADMLGLGAASGMQWHTWRTGAGSPYGITLGIAACAMGLALVARPVRRPGAARPASLLALIGVGLALAASGHASTAPPQWATRAAVFLHATGVALWVGALLPLAGTLRAGSLLGPRVLTRFSRLVVYPLAALVLTGLTLAVIQLGDFSALPGTDYGRVLVLKLALVTLVLLLAAANRWRLTGAAVRGEPGGAGRLRRSIAVETVMLLAILAVVALWRFTVPPRSLAHADHTAAAQESRQLQLHDARAMVNLQLTPGRAGPVSITASIRGGASAALDARQVSYTLANSTVGIEALHAQASQVSPGVWRADGVLIPTAGRWTVRVTILIDEFTQVSLQGTVTLDH